jgi:hypothetical protein
MRVKIIIAMILYLILWLIAMEIIPDSVFDHVAQRPIRNLATEPVTDPDTGEIYFWVMDTGSK